VALGDIEHYQMESATAAALGDLIRHLAVEMEVYQDLGEEVREQLAEQGGEGWVRKNYFSHSPGLPARPAVTKRSSMRRCMTYRKGSPWSSIWSTRAALKNRTAAIPCWLSNREKL